MATVNIPQGKLKGGEVISENGRKYYEFLCVPYAQPPVDDLRFKNPRPHLPWEGVRDATKSNLTNTSCQKNFMTGQLTGSEDCLYLNVMTPQLPSPGSKLLPVMVYIHGGGFIYGSGINKDDSNPELLVENDVVVVSINYRLGVLGFLALDIPEAPGNMGLKDQVKALHWIQKNIDKFGGDKDNVTLFGISAGSASIEFLLLSPLAKGLFHKAILQSGSSLNDWAISLQNKQLTLNLADKLGYKGDKQDKRALYNFFMKIPAAELSEAGFFVTETFTAKSIFFGFVPTIEKDFDGAFLTTHPYKLLKEGNFNKVPVIRGFCEYEGLLMSMMKPLAVKELLENKSFMNFWSYKLDSGDIDKYDKKFRSAYLEKIQPEDEPDKVAVEFFGDLHFTAGIWVASLLSAKFSVPQYVYKFSYDGKLNYSKALLGVMKKGASHGDDTYYILKNANLSHAEDADKLIRSQLTKMWTNFAKTSDPTPSDSGLPLEWPKFTANKRALLTLDRTFTIQDDYEPEKMAVFEEIYAKYEK